MAVLDIYMYARGSPSLVISLEGVTVIFMICPEGCVGNTISVLGGVLKNTPRWGVHYMHTCMIIL